MAARDGEDAICAVKTGLQDACEELQGAGGVAGAGILHCQWIGNATLALNVPAAARDGQDGTRKGGEVRRGWTPQQRLFEDVTDEEPGQQPQDKEGQD